MLKAGYRRVHAVRVAIDQRFKDREVATKKEPHRASIPRCGFCIHIWQIRQRRLYQGPIHGAAFRINALQFRQLTGVRLRSDTA